MYKINLNYLCCIIIWRYICKKWLNKTKQIGINGLIDKKIEDIIFKTLDQAGYITTSNDKIVKNGIKRVIHLLEDFSFV